MHLKSKCGFFLLQTSRETGNSFHWHPPPFISSIISYHTINIPLQELIYTMTTVETCCIDIKQTFNFTLN